MARWIVEIGLTALAWFVCSAWNVYVLTCHFDFQDELDREILRGLSAIVGPVAVPILLVALSAEKARLTKERREREGREAIAEQRRVDRLLKDEGVL